ncbi:hypothetical protein RUMHYD_03122 [Blautia hydrogenotrophica DSM 10507]|uniref:Uncharacterized protein n=1 Tax=Blautia hydrogenotrophica (strain DSM 10507 / JCM 14656 / S5a33) TaxID=476272 RepID=C0CQG6_BLAHS|nr:hypothetical protein RUMHYD_03122 [Blautia hydrogenotrophica DSM 10507]
MKGASLIQMPALKNIQVCFMLPVHYMAELIPVTNKFFDFI